MGHTVFEGWLDNRFVNRIVHKAVFGVAMLFCIGWSALASVESGASAAASVAAQAEWEGWATGPQQGQTMCTLQRPADVKNRTFIHTAG